MSSKTDEEVGTSQILWVIESERWLVKSQFSRPIQTTRNQSLESMEEKVVK